MGRTSGILLPVYSLPGRGGIGALGHGAMEFLDFLKSSGVGVWQMLPLGPTGFGDSPYSPLSSFAGNPWFVDPELLWEQGLITRQQLDALPEGGGRVNYRRVMSGRQRLLESAFSAALESRREELEHFLDSADRDLQGYIVYSVLKENNRLAPWYEWPEASQDFDRLCRKTLCGHRERALFYAFCQLEFRRQFSALKARAAELGIALMGDIPFYAAADSADVFSSRELFRLDRTGRPAAVAGVPPDYFSADGQLWGNPLYRWDAMAKDGYGWWMRRVAAAAEMFDIIRLDHFRAFDSYWSVKAGEPTARNGRWLRGPGRRFITRLRESFPGTRFVAEDLGDLGDSVKSLLGFSGFPGMKVLQFGFYEGSNSEYLPHNHTANTVAYTGTHDNDTTAGWLKGLSPGDREFCREYLGSASVDSLIRAAYRSVAELAVVPMQDWLGLGSAARTNTPGTGVGNWQWRLRKKELTPELAQRIRRMGGTYSRL